MMMRGDDKYKETTLITKEVEKHKLRVNKYNISLVEFKEGEDRNTKNKCCVSQPKITRHILTIAYKYFKNYYQRLKY